MWHSYSNGAEMIREAGEEDMAQIAEIYAHHVMKGLASFEETAPSVEEMLGRMRAVRAAGLPYLVLEIEARVVGYCYATPYRARSAYRFSVEDSVYVREGFGGRGIGRQLLAALLDYCGAGPWKQVIAVIGDSGNHASIGLHQALGFRVVGTLESVGFKFGRWVDSVLMQRAL